MQKQIIAITLLLLLLVNVSQTTAVISEIKTRVIDIDVIWDAFTLFDKNQNALSDGVILSINTTGEIWNTAEYEVSVLSGSTGCPSHGIAIANFSATFDVSPFLPDMCLDDVEADFYEPGITAIVQQFSFYFPNQIIGFNVNGTIEISFPLLQLEEQNIYGASIQFSDSQPTIIYDDSTLWDETDVIQGNDTISTYDENLEIGYSLIQSLIVVLGMLSVQVMLQKRKNL